MTDYIFDINLDTFEEKVIIASQSQPVLVDFWAEWCSPCLFIAPILKQVLKNYKGNVLLAKLEVDEGKNMKLAGQYQVRGFPTIILFEKGQAIARFSSARPAHFIKEFIETNSQLLEL
ncbi:MAG: thioredoxin [Cocleimonas sp.]|nr:thioredoxin [Cocleimonas sp.]